MKILKFIFNNKLLSLFILVVLSSMFSQPSASESVQSTLPINIETQPNTTSFSASSPKTSTKPKDTATPSKSASQMVDIACVEADAIVVQTGPSSSYDTVGWRSRGDCEQIAAYNSDKSWGRINNTNTWVPMSFLIIEGSVSSNSSTSSIRATYTPIYISTSPPTSLPNYAYSTSTPASDGGGDSGGGSECHPSYSGACLLMGIGDYDCAGGSGDGPNYVTGPIFVNGPDPFGLDRDKDGIACEK